MTPDFTRSARMAYKTLLALHIDAFPVDPLLILRHCKNLVIRTYDDITPLFGMSDPYHFKYYLANNQDAMTVRRDFPDGATGYELFYDSHTDPRRRRFTLAHELGHIVMKHSMEAWWEEKEADYFASQLLAPRPVFDLFASHGLPIDDPDFVWRTFGMSRTASNLAAKSPPKHFADDELYDLIRDQFETYCDREEIA